MNILLLVQAFPPAFVNGGGVSKRYHTLVMELVKTYDYKFTILTPINIMQIIDEELSGFIDSGRVTFVHLACNAGRMGSNGTYGLIMKDSEPIFIHHLPTHDLVIMDDIPLRGSFIALASQYEVPCIATTHTDIRKLSAFDDVPLVIDIYSHLHENPYNCIHATVSKVYADTLNTPYVWPPIIWNNDFLLPCNVNDVEKQRSVWRNTFPPEVTAYLVFCGRIGPEKQIPLLLQSIPSHAGLILVGQGEPTYASHVLELIQSMPNVIFENRHCGGDELRSVYGAMDMLVSASGFETLGNTLIESWVHDKPVAVLPEQGHNEFLRDGYNGFAIHYRDPARAKRELTDAISRIGTLPGVVEQGDYFRKLNFAKEFHDRLIVPAKQIQFTPMVQIVNRGIYESTRVVRDVILPHFAHFAGKDYFDIEAKKVYTVD
jgi:glycosyltransferase involved in cell wall biosynthesis